MKSIPSASIVEYRVPNHFFWKAYEELWNNSFHKSPFQAPHIIQYLAKKYKDDLMIYQCRSQGKLVGVAFFRLKNNIYNFLTDIKSDHNFFVLDKNTSHELIRDFFKDFIYYIKKEKWSVVLNKQPMWAKYMDIFLEVGAESKLYWQNMNYQVCPILKSDSADSLYNILKKSRNNRYKMNRFRKDENGIFETLTDDDDLENWVKEFCLLHTKRWKDTNTPSLYASKEKQDFLVQCLRNWNKDNLLVRFSAKVGDKRIAFCIGLLQNNRLIYHSLTYDVNYSKYSPIKILILFMGEWMSKNNFNILDFGIGNETYKYRFANEELKLNRIFISHQANIPFILKSKVIKSVRENSSLYQFYTTKIKPRVRHVLH